jgi:hypothetical protein
MYFHFIFVDVVHNFSIDHNFLSHLDFPTKFL